MRWARKRSGLTQTQLAGRAGLSRTLVVEIEGGTRNATDENLIKLAAAMNCPVVVLERKRVPESSTETTPAAAHPVSGVRGDERADESQLQEMRSGAVERSA